MTSNEALKARNDFLNADKAVKKHQDTLARFDKYGELEEPGRTQATKDAFVGVKNGLDAKPVDLKGKALACEGKWNEFKNSAETELAAPPAEKKFFAIAREAKAREFNQAHKALRRDHRDCERSKKPWPAR